MRPVDEIAVELVFPAAYDVRLKVLVEVAGGGGAWSGLVANAAESVSGAHSGVYSTPSPAALCVVARGDAYFVDAEAPERWWMLEDSPVVAVRCAVAEKLLVFASPWRVIAVGEAGVAWRTSRLAIDGIALGEAVGGELAGVADPDDDEAQDFVIELRTGHHCGGFTFPR